MTSTPPTLATIPWRAVRRRLAMMVLVPLLALCLTPTVGCSMGTGLRVRAQETPLQQFTVGVLVHPEKAESPEFDENVVFYNYLMMLTEQGRCPFPNVELVTDPAASGADVLLSLNLDINYVTQVSRAADLPKILTLYIYAVLGLPTYNSNANYHLSAVLYDREMNPLNAWFVNEPVTFMWDNQYWAPQPLSPHIWEKPYNRLLNLMDQDIRHQQNGGEILGSFRAH